jgi:hypothetical protein
MGKKEEEKEEISPLVTALQICLFSFSNLSREKKKKKIYSTKNHDGTSTMVHVQMSEKGNVSPREEVKDHKLTKQVALKGVN